MPRKGRRNPKDAVANEGTSPENPLDLQPHEKRLAAFEVRNGILTCALIQSPSKVNPLELEATLRYSITSITEKFTSEKLKELLPNPETFLIITTEESYPQITAIKKAGLDVMIIERARAIYYAHTQEAGREPCLVVSTEADHTSCSLIVNGGVVAKQQDARDLSHVGIWRNYVESQQNLARTIEFYSLRDPTFEPTLFETFLSVWKRGKGVTVGKYSFSEQIDVTSSLASFRKLIDAADPKGSARVVVLSDWAASHSNLGILLRPEFRVVGDNSSRAFTQAFEGLVLFGLNELSKSERPELRVSKKKVTLGSVTKGTPLRADFKIQNTGGGILHAKVIPSDAWLKVTPDAVTCGKGQGQAVVIEAESSALAAGVTHPSQIEIEWSDGVSLKQERIPVSVEILAPSVVLTGVKKLIPKRKAVVASTPVTSAALGAEQPKPEALPEPMPESPTGQPLAGPILEAAQDRKPLQVLGRVMLVAVLVGAVILFLALWRPHAPVPVSRDPANTKAASPTPENGSLTVANPPVASAEPSTTVANSAATPLDLSNQNNTTPTDGLNSQLAVLTLYANTDDVRASVDGTDVILGRRYEVKSFKLAPGQHSIKATKEGYTSWETSLELSQGSSRTLNIALQQTQAAVSEPTLLPSQIALGYEQRATELFSHQRYDEAIGECNSGLAKDPTSESLLRLKRRIEKAKEILAKSTDTNRSQGGEHSSTTPVGAPKPQPDRIEPAVMISKSSITYPLAAKNAKVSGTVVVAVTIDEQGRVTSARATDGPAMLRNAAIDAAKQCRFRPAREGGRPVPSSMSVNFNFVLN
jgi:TonB family protein